MEGAHKSRYMIHLGFTKMYHDHKEIYWWNNMKGDVASFVSKCMVYQQVKVAYLRIGGLYQEIEFPMWKWEVINMNFVTGLPQSRN